MTTNAGRLVMWAVIVHPPRSSWIYYPSIKRTRREAIDAWLEGYSDRVKAALQYRRNRRRRYLTVERVEIIVEGSR